MPETSSRIPVRRLVVEAVTIVASILLALGIEAGWDGHQERQAELQLLEIIRGGFTSNQTTIRDQLDLQDRLGSAIHQFLSIVAAADPGSTVSVPDSSVAAALASPSYDPITTTLDAAMSSGQLDLIRSSDVRRAVADWRNVLVDLRENELGVREGLNALLLPQLGDVRLTRIYENLVAWAGGDSDARARLAGSQRLRAATELENALATQLFSVGFIVRDLRALLEIQTTLLRVIDDELSSTAGSS